ncbi:GNAT family N-acetyltransferase [Legionella sp. CNM-4043-24]|uniref:GNAT family N-acetyltransferase n=1 Tax=Legionella sp. CNM-4043-24 TaxID=3421646 RepID=UPI00403A843B
MLIRNHKLSLLQQQDLEQLAALCLAKDGGLPKIYHDLLSQQRETESNFLYYQSDRLVGFASVYFFYEDACEVSLLVAPELRKQRIARELVRAMLPLLVSRGMKRVIFSFSDTSDNDWIQSLDFVYYNSEYHMRRDSPDAPPLQPRQLHIRRAVMDDLPVLYYLDKACFSEHHADMTQRFTRLLLNPEYEILVAEKDGKCLGKAHLRWQPDTVLLSDIAIAPPWQGLGLGSELLSQVITHVLSLGRQVLSLDVESDKSTALNLYLKQGFRIITRYEYWQIELEKLSRIFLLS